MIQMSNRETEHLQDTAIVIIRKLVTRPMSVSSAGESLDFPFLLNKHDVKGDTYTITDYISHHAIAITIDDVDWLITQVAILGEDENKN